jgi:hypothetical protein
VGEDLYTQQGGGAGFLNVPVGFATVTAYRRDGTRIGSAQLGAVAGQITVGSVRPDFYSRTAEITSAPAVEMSNGMGGSAGSGG